LLNYHKPIRGRRFRADISASVAARLGFLFAMRCAIHGGVPVTPLAGRQRDALTILSERRI
jgi:hypothetical protein